MFSESLAADGFGGKSQRNLAARCLPQDHGKHQGTNDNRRARDGHRAKQDDEEQSSHGRVCYLALNRGMPMKPTKH
jgi:hypothetical protein